MGPRAGRAHPEVLERLRQLGPHLLELGRRGAHSRVDARLQLDRRPVGLRVQLALELGARRGQHVLDPVGERPRAGLDEHHLLLDAERVGACLVAARPLGPGGGRGPLARLGVGGVGLLFHQPRFLDVGAGGLDERLEQRQLAGDARKAFGVPLHADHELVAVGRLDGLDDAVGRPRDGPQALAELVDRLMVEGVDLDLERPDDLGEAAVGVDPHRVGLDLGVLPLAVRDLARAEVLVQAAAARHVQRLHPAADREHRHLALVGPARDRELDEVELRPRRPQLRRGALRVGLGIEVGPAREAEAVDLVEQGVDRVGPERRHHHGYPARELDRPHVGEAERHLVARRLALRDLAHVLGLTYLGRGDTDQRMRGRAALPHPRCGRTTAQQADPRSGHSWNLDPKGAILVLPTARFQGRAISVVSSRDAPAGLECLAHSTGATGFDVVDRAKGCRSRTPEASYKNRHQPIRADHEFALAA